jgi:hypothetical protein
MTTTSYRSRRGLAPILALDEMLSSDPKSEAGHSGPCSRGMIDVREAL